MGLFRRPSNNSGHGALRATVTNAFGLAQCSRPPARDLRFCIFHWQILWREPRFPIIRYPGKAMPLSARRPICPCFHSHSLSGCPEPGALWDSSKLVLPSPSRPSPSACAAVAVTIHRFRRSVKVSAIPSWRWSVVTVFSVSMASVKQLSQPEGCCAAVRTLPP